MKSKRHGRLRFHVPQNLDHRGVSLASTSAITSVSSGRIVLGAPGQTTVWRAEPKAKQMSFPLRLGPVLVIGAIVQDDVVVDELNVARLELDSR